jgi:hypothetical protein
MTDLAYEAKIANALKNVTIKPLIERIDALSPGESFMVSFKDKKNPMKWERWFQTKIAVHNELFKDVKKLRIKRTKLSYIFEVKFPTKEEWIEARIRRARKLAECRTHD